MVRQFLARPGVRRRVLFVVLAALAVWVGFLDSHSILRRVTYYQELSALTQENETLTRENATLATRVDAGLSATTAEAVAREQYGMRRPGETVYRVVPAEAEGE